MLRAHAATQPAAVRTDPAAAAVIRRLTPEFRDQPGPRIVERIVLQARHDLDDLHPPALPELLERLALLVPETTLIGVDLLLRG